MRAYIYNVYNMLVRIEKDVDLSLFINHLLYINTDKSIYNDFGRLKFLRSITPNDTLDAGYVIVKLIH